MIKPYYDQDGITIYCGDCREILPQLDVKVDLVLTDPPYGIGIADWDILVDYYSLLPLKKDASVYIWANDESLVDVRVRALSYWEFRKTLIWEKEVGHGGRDWQDCHEFCLFFTVSDDWYFNQPQRKLTSNASLQNGKLYGGERTILRAEGFNSNCSERLAHPTQKPLSIINKLVFASSEPGDLILDPFLGSGTTLVAAKILGRKAIGIEIERKYCDIAVERLRQSVMKLE
jgi:site-specific DNA-methyltransferase (adenine-specific)